MVLQQSVAARMQHAWHERIEQPFYGILSYALFFVNWAVLVGFVIQGWLIWPMAAGMAFGLLVWVGLWKLDFSCEYNILNLKFSAFINLVSFLISGGYTLLIQANPEPLPNETVLYWFFAGYAFTVMAMVQGMFILVGVAFLALLDM